MAYDGAILEAKRLLKLPHKPLDDCNRPLINQLNKYFLLLEVYFAIAMKLQITETLFCCSVRDGAGHVAYTPD